MRFTAGILGSPPYDDARKDGGGASVLRLAEGSASASGRRCGAGAGVRARRLAVGLLVPLLEARLPIAPVAVRARAAVAAAPAAPERAAEQQGEEEEEEERGEETETAGEEGM